ncbi:MAG TPA: substrate-binding domain-containing protein [Gaiellaceae bacterium]|nr:substrate-binding domain-containing protein [Gaiellaceae bacterium]
MSEVFDRASALRLAASAAVTSRLRFPATHPRWRFVFVNHALTNPFFIPARYGSDDAAKVLDVSVTWTGSRSSDVGEMVKAMKHAVDTRAHGIAVSIIDETAFNATTELALKHGIPVVAYNADGGKANKRLAYIGQDNYQSGLEMGARIVSLVPEGQVCIFIATPNQQNIQPRVDGALDAIRDSGQPLRVHVVASGVDVVTERKKIEASYRANPHVRGLFAVDAGSTQGVADVMLAHRLHAKGVRGGGYDLLPATLQAIHDRHLDFTIDQQPYLQGFLPVLQLFLDRYSSGLVAPADTNTGLNFVTRKTVARYLTTRSRFEGSSSAESFPVSPK